MLGIFGKLPLIYQLYPIISTCDRRQWRKRIFLMAVYLERYRWIRLIVVKKMCFTYAGGTPKCPLRYTAHYRLY